MIPTTNPRLIPIQLFEALGEVDTAALELVDKADPIAPVALLNTTLIIFNGDIPLEPLEIPLLITLAASLVKELNPLATYINHILDNGVHQT